jgi:RNA polymerase sigma-70 factor (sigma-E family)
MGVDVLAMVRQGVDRGSFAAVFNAHHRAAVRLAYLLTSDADQAEDIVADAFAKVYVRWSKGEVRDVGSYLRRAVANEANSKLRRRYLERRESERRTGDDRGVVRVDDGAADRDEVWQAIQRLPDRQRKAIVLRYYEDLSEADTAEVLGCSVGTVKSQVSRGLARMQELLDRFQRLDIDPIVVSSSDRSAVLAPFLDPIVQSVSQ